MRINRVISASTDSVCAQEACAKQPISRGSTVLNVGIQSMYWDIRSAIYFR